MAWETKARLNQILARIRSEPRLDASRYRPEQSVYRASFNAIVSRKGPIDAPKTLVTEANLSRRALEEVVANAANGFTGRKPNGHVNNNGFGNLKNNRFAPAPRHPQGASPASTQERPSIPSSSSNGHVAEAAQANGRGASTANQAAQMKNDPRADSMPRTSVVQQEAAARKTGGAPNQAHTLFKPKAYSVAAVPDKPPDYSEKLYAQPMRKKQQPMFKPPPRNGSAPRFEPPPRNGSAPRFEPPPRRGSRDHQV